MPIEQIGTYYLSDNPREYEVQRNNNYEFVVTHLEDLVRPGVPDGADNRLFKDAERILRVSVSSAFIPHFTQDVVQVKRGNTTLKYAGLPTFGEGTLRFQDFVDADVKSILMAWQHLSYNVDTEQVASLQRTAYKKDCYLLEYPPDYYAPHRGWLLKGCWISGLSESEYTNDNGDKHEISATIQYDYAKLDPSIIVTDIQTRGY